MRFDRVLGRNKLAALRCEVYAVVVRIYKIKSQKHRDHIQRPNDVTGTFWCIVESSLDS